MGVQRSIALDALLACWGLGTWLGVNGIYVQLPLLLQSLPEGWALPASMVLAVALGNVGLFIFALLHRLRPSAPDAQYVYALLFIGTTALALNAFLYDRTAIIGDTSRSVSFLTLTFFAAFVGCTSSIVFYPYMRYFRDVYLPTYLFGEGLSGFLPSILALIQGVGGASTCEILPDGNVVEVTPPPRFGVTVFILILAALSAVSLASFTIIERSSRFDSEHVTPVSIAKDEKKKERESMLSTRWVIVLVLMLALSALSNGVLPSVQSYSCMPYGNRAYHLAVTLSAMANPAACLCGVWLRPAPVRLLTAGLLVTLAPLAYILATALLSPTPPLHHQPIGEALIVIVWVWVNAVVSYARMWVYGWARAGGARGMRVVGALGQVGSVLGAVTLFVLVNYTELFTQYDQCVSTTF